MLTLLKFKAEWCNPCKAMSPIVAQLDAEDDGLIVQDVDIEDNPQLRADYFVRAVPTFVVIKDGKEVARRVGSATLSELRELVDGSRNL
jgi:thioredoxin 1